MPGKPIESEKTITPKSLLKNLTVGVAVLAILVTVVCLLVASVCYKPSDRQLYLGASILIVAAIYVFQVNEGVRAHNKPLSDSNYPEVPVPVPVQSTLPAPDNNPE